MKKEEQIRMLLHPEDYTDEQLDQMLDETDVKVPDTNEEWEEFRGKREEGRRKRLPLLKIAAMEDAELATILSEIATFYQCEVVYKSEASNHIRLYFTWDKKATIDELIDTFNKFERIHITREDKKLIVE